jgi:hypothetical protein
VKLFVAKVVLEQHDETIPFVVCTKYKGILEAFRTKKNLAMIPKLLIAL